MHKITTDCEACGNAADIRTDGAEEPGFCPFCGEPFDTGNVQVVDDDEDEGDDGWGFGI